MNQHPPKLRLPLESLADLLRAEGFVLGPDSLLAMQRVLAAPELGQAGSPELLASLLAPIVCRDRAEQERFHRLFKQHLAELAALPLCEEGGLSDELPPPRRRKLLWGAVALAALGIALWFGGPALFDRMFPTPEPPLPYRLPVPRLVAELEQPTVGQEFLVREQSRLMGDSLPPGLLWSWWLADSLGRDSLLGHGPDSLRLRLPRPGTSTLTLRWRQGQDSASASLPLVAAAPGPPEFLDLPPAELLPMHQASRWVWESWAIGLLAALALMLAALLELLLRFRKMPDAARESDFRRKYENADGAPSLLPLPPQDELLQAGPELEPLARLMRARKGGGRLVLDIAESLRQSIRHAGWPRPRFKSLSRPSEYVVLIDTAGGDNQRALHERVVRQLQREEVHLERYWYSADPRTVWRPETGEAFSLERLRARHPDHSLIIFGDGDRLLWQGRPATWLQTQLLPWGERALLTPVAVAQWGGRESLLAEHFVLRHANPAGALEAVGLLHSARENVRALFRAQRALAGNAPPDAWAEPDPEALRRYLGPSAFAWAAAMAHVEKPDWESTLAVGYALERLGGAGGAQAERLLTLDNLARMAALDWWAKADMPDAWRAALAPRVSAPDDRTARKAMVELLEKAEAPPGSMAAGEKEIRLTRHRLALSPDDPALRAEWRWLQEKGLVPPDPTRPWTPWLPALRAAAFLLAALVLGWLARPEQVPRMALRLPADSAAWLNNQALRLAQADSLPQARALLRAAIQRQQPDPDTPATNLLNLEYDRWLDLYRDRRFDSLAAGLARFDDSTDLRLLHLRGLAEFYAFEMQAALRTDTSLMRAAAYDRIPEPNLATLFGRRTQDQQQRYQAALLADDIATYELFLFDFPESRNLDEINKRLATLHMDRDAWESALRSNTCEALQVYLQDWPDGKKIEDAKRMAQQLCGGEPISDPDLLAWQEAQRQNTCEAYTDYLKSQPQGQFRREAERKQEELCQAPLETPKMVLVRGGTFQMGSTVDVDEKPSHSVTVSDFLMGKHEVTQRLWQEVMGANPSHFKYCQDCPVEQVSWYKAVEFCNALSVREGLSPCYSGSWDAITCDWTANGYRLPTEAEWEYAAGGGSSGRTKFAGTDSEGSLGSYAWYSANTDSKTHPVGQKSPNRLGLYDMSGNVWEWCSDWSGPYTSGVQINPRGANSGSRRVHRGGDWDDVASRCRVANRSYSSPGNRYFYLGFRLARTL